MKSVDKLPELLKSPNEEKCNPRVQCTLVAFDLEGTGLLHENGQMVQLSAIYRDEQGAQHQFDEYILPTRAFSPEAAEVTGFKVTDGVLYKQGKAVTTVSLKHCLDQFIKWLSQTPEVPVLVGHNCFSFDAPLLCASLHDEGLFDQFCEVVESGGFADSLNMARDVYPKLKNYRLSDLTKALLSGRRYDTHNALGDAKALYDILMLRRITLDDIMAYSQKPHGSYGAYSRRLIENIVRNRPSFEFMTAGSISNRILNEISGAGYNFEHLKMIVKKRGMAGIRDLYETELNLRKSDMVEMKLFVFAAEDLLGINS